MRAMDYLRSVFGRQPASPERQRAWLLGAQPIFTSYGQDVYLSDFVNNAIDRVATEVSKIEVRSVTIRDDRISVNQDSITRLFKAKPNEFQTASDFLSSVEWLRRKHCNAFVYPKPERVGSRDISDRGDRGRRYAAFYPLNPTGVYIGTEGGRAAEIRLEFEDGYAVTLPYGELIHLKWRRGCNPMAGGSDRGEVVNQDLLRTIQALDKTIQGLPKSIEAGLQIKGVYHAKTVADSVRLKNIREDFEDHILTSKTGMIATDLGGEFTPVNLGTVDIPKDAMDFLKAVIQERYGVSAAILSGDYNGEQHSAFYQTAIEDFIIQLEQAGTACLYTPREQEEGRQIKGYYSKVNYMDQKDKMELAGLAKETGLMTLNQINEMFGIPPFPEGDRRLQSLNYVNIDQVDEYQRARVERRSLREEETV